MTDATPRTPIEEGEGALPAVQHAYQAAFTGALNDVFVVAALVCVLGFVLSWILPERPLRATIAEAAREPGRDAAGAFARPADPGAAATQLQAAFARLADRDVQRQHIEQVVRRAGETLSPLASAGCDVFDRLVEARRAHLAELAAEWNPGEDQDIAEYLRETARSVVPRADRGMQPA